MAEARCEYLPVWPGSRNIDYKVLRAIPGRFSPLRNIPPPDQKPETRGINIKTGPFVRAESVKVRP
jgi:hypothetical protein